MTETDVVDQKPLALGYFHARKSDVHAGSALDRDPAFESFDLVMRRDYDALAARLAEAEAALREIARDKAPGSTRCVTLQKVARAYFAGAGGEA